MMIMDMTVKEVCDKLSRLTDNIGVVDAGYLYAVRCDFSGTKTGEFLKKATGLEFWDFTVTESFLDELKRAVAFMDESEKLYKSGDISKDVFHAVKKNEHCLKEIESTMS